jgi:hypothetical protein
MSTDATSESNKTLDEIILNAKNTSEMVENLRQYNIGIASRELTVPPPAPPPVAPSAPAPRNAVRFVYPSGNMRFEIHGVNEADLDRQEEAIRKIYAGK